MLWLLHCQHIMVKEVDQFCLMMYIALETSQISLHVYTVGLVITTAPIMKMLQQNAYVC